MEKKEPKTAHKREILTQHPNYLKDAASNIMSQTTYCEAIS